MRVLGGRIGRRVWRRLPQHIFVSFQGLGEGINQGRRLAQPLEQACGARERQPGHHPWDGALGDEQGGGGGDKQTQTIETIGQAAQPTGPERSAGTEDDVARTIFRRQQVRDAPRRQRRQNEPDDEIVRCHDPQMQNVNECSYAERLIMPVVRSGSVVSVTV